MNPVTMDPEIMHGTPCFRGTRVPVSFLFGWLSGGHTVDGFLEDFPSVARDQVLLVLENAKHSLVKTAEAVA